jgi:hypothetical protein
MGKVIKTAKFTQPQEETFNLDVTIKSIMDWVQEMNKIQPVTRIMVSISSERETQMAFSPNCDVLDFQKFATHAQSISVQTLITRALKGGMLYE